MNPIHMRCPDDECTNEAELVGTGFITDFGGQDRWVDHYRCPAGHEVWLDTTVPEEDE